MFVTLRLLMLPADRIDARDRITLQLAGAAEQLAGSAASWAAPTFDGAGLNAGHIVWRMESPTEAAALAVPLEPVWSGEIAPLLAGALVTTIGYRIMRSGVRRAGAGIWRALIFRVMPAGMPRAVALESELLLMPKYVPAIRSWALSPTAFCDAAKTFTHVWEQEFDSLTGLTGDYMTHPVHWGVVDKWFDAECPDYIVDPHLIQVVGAIDSTIMRAEP